MHSTSPKRIPRLAHVRMKIAGPVSNSRVCRTFAACETSFRPKPRLAQSSASPEMPFAPARTTLENSDTANKVLLTYVSLTSSVITSATSESIGLRAGAGLLVAAIRGAFNASLDYIERSSAPQPRAPHAGRSSAARKLRDIEGKRWREL